MYIKLQHYGTVVQQQLQTKKLQQVLTTDLLISFNIHYTFHPDTGFLETKQQKNLFLMAVTIKAPRDLGKK